MFGGAAAAAAGAAGELASALAAASGEEVRVGKHTVRVKRQIGEGGFAFIFLCDDLNTSGEWVLKKMYLQNQEQRSVAEKEISLLRRLKHPNIVGLIDAELTGRMGLLLLEFCSGGHLLHILNRRNGRLPPTEDVLRIFADVVQAVHHMHSLDVAHRDLKLENVLRGGDGKYKICDFGSAVEGVVPLTNAQERAAEEERIEKTTTLMYRAPEMVELYMAQQLDTKVDIWALGCVLYAVAYLKHPINAESKLGILNARITFPDAEINTTPAAVAMRELILRMLTQNPATRPDIAEVHGCVEAALEGRPLPPRAVPSDASDHNSSLSESASGKSMSRRNSRSKMRAAPAAAPAPAPAALAPNSVAARRLAAAHSSGGGGGGSGGGALLTDVWNGAASPVPVVTPAAAATPTNWAPADWGVASPAAAALGATPVATAAGSGGAWANFDASAGFASFSASPEAAAALTAGGFGAGMGEGAPQGFGQAVGIGGSAHATSFPSRNGAASGGAGGLLDLSLPQQEQQQQQQPFQQQQQQTPKAGGNINELAAALRGTSISGGAPNADGAFKSNGLNNSAGGGGSTRFIPGPLDLEDWSTDASGSSHSRRNSSNTSNAAAAVFLSNGPPLQTQGSGTGPSLGGSYHHQYNSSGGSLGNAGSSGAERPQSLPMRSAARGSVGSSAMAANTAYSLRLALATASASAGGANELPQGLWSATPAQSARGVGQTGSWSLTQGTVLPQQQLPRAPHQYIKPMGMAEGVAARPFTGDPNSFGMTWPAPQPHSSGNLVAGSSGGGGIGGLSSSGTASPTAWGGATPPPPPPSSPAMGVSSPMGATVGPAGALNLHALGGLSGSGHGVVHMQTGQQQHQQQAWPAWPAAMQSPPAQQPLQQQQQQQQQQQAHMLAPQHPQYQPGW